MLELFVVKSSQGKYFRSKGLHGRGESWVEEISRAKIYTKVGPAKSVLTWWTNNVKDFSGDVIKLTVKESEVVSFDKNVGLRRSLEKKLRYAQRNLEYFVKQYQANNQRESLKNLIEKQGNVVKELTEKIEQLKQSK